MALRVIHDLHEYVTGRAGDDETRTRLGAHDLLAKTRVTTSAAADLLLPLVPRAMSTHPLSGLAADYLARVTHALALVEQDADALRMLAATSPTACLSIPLTVSLLLPSTAKLMPWGGSTVMECE